MLVCPVRKYVKPITTHFLVCERCESNEPSLKIQTNPKRRLNHPFKQETDYLYVWAICKTVQDVLLIGKP